MEYFATALAVYALLIALLFFTQRSLLYHPDQTIPDPAAYGVPEMTAVRVPTDDGFELLAWWRAPRDAGRPVLAVFHGNAGHIGGRAHKVRDYLDAGYGVLLLGYRYNAGSGGRPSEANLFADARAGLDFLKRQGILETQIVPYGESLGSGVAVAVAATHRVGALVLEAAYSSMADLAQHHYWYAPSRWLVRDRFDSISRIGNVAAPLLVLHGERDTVIPPKFGRKLFDAAPEPKEAHFLPEGLHNDLPDHGIAVLTIDFLDRYFKP
jgi:fermentation-respiration switch protein FrsA (DUF1100 family)